MVRAQAFDAAPRYSPVRFSIELYGITNAKESQIRFAP